MLLQEFIALCLGVGAGLVSALVPRTRFDYTAMGLAVLDIGLEHLMCLFR